MPDQAAFQAAVKSADLDVPEGLRDGADRLAGKRFNVYRNNVAVALTEALEVGFPTIVKLIGSENFKKVAALFWRAHPPDSPVLAQYGTKLPDFLAGFEPLAAYPYLADVARLDLALRQSYHAADHRPADLSVLATLDEAALNGCRFDLAPSLIMLRSPYPVLDIWRFNNEPGAPKPTAQAQDVLVLRPEFDPRLVSLGPGAAEALAALMAGQTLGAAQAAGLAASGQFDLGGLLSTLMEGYAITAILIAEGAS